MSGVWNMERVNINSQCSEALLPLIFATSIGFGIVDQAELALRRDHVRDVSKCWSVCVTPKM